MSDTVQTPVTATHFSLVGTPLLSVGQSMDLVAAAPQLWIHAKVYAEGGENGVHAHPSEDHAFFVLAGEATFVDVDGKETVVGSYQGMMIPRGVAYAFASSSEENLVMLRVGAGEQHPDGIGNDGLHPRTRHRVAVDGTDAPGTDDRNKSAAIKGMPIPGRTFQPRNR